MNIRHKVKTKQNTPRSSRALNAIGSSWGFILCAGVRKEVLGRRVALSGVGFGEKVATANSAERAGTSREVILVAGASEARNEGCGWEEGGALQTQRHTLKFNLEQFFLHCLSGFVFKLKSLF